MNSIYVDQSEKGVVEVNKVGSLIDKAHIFYLVVLRLVVAESMKKSGLEMTFFGNIKYHLSFRASPKLFYTMV